MHLAVRSDARRSSMMHFGRRTSVSTARGGRKSSDEQLARKSSGRVKKKGTAAEAKNSKSCSRKLFHVVRAIALMGGAEWVSDRRDPNPNAAGRT